MLITFAKTKEYFQFDINGNTGKFVLMVVT